MVCTIYTLSDPNTGEIRYIGQTTSVLSKRLTDHIASARKGKNYLHNWIKSVNYSPIIELLEDNAVWNESEIYWIEQFRQWGFRLVNSTKGGDGILGHKFTTESRLKMSKSLSKPRKPLTRNHKYKISITKKGIATNKKYFIVLHNGTEILIKGRKDVANYIGCSYTHVGHILRNYDGIIGDYKIYKGDSTRNT